MPGPTNPTIRVPIQTPMFNEPEASRFTISRPWVIFFEKRPKAEGGGGSEHPHRTVLLKNLGVGDDIADHVTVYAGGGTCNLVTGVLRKAIEEDLTLRIKLYDGTTGSLLYTVGEFTIPADTPINTVVEFTEEIEESEFPDGSVLAWDITESDEQFDKAGVAAFSVYWQ